MTMKTILLIEDDADVRDNTAEILELARYRVLKAENGKRGVDIARKELPDLILCDIMMPELDGYGVLHLLGRDPATAEIPLVFLSAKAERSDVRKGMELGADDYLTKPFEESELLNAIESRLRRLDLFKRGFDHTVEGMHKLMDKARETGALDVLSKDRKTRSVERKEILFQEGDDMRQVFMVLKGKVRTFKMNDDGKELVTGLHGEGDLLGYMPVLEHTGANETAEAMEPSEVAVIPREDLINLMYRDRDISIRFIKLLARDVKEKEARLLELAYAPVRQRVARALLRLRDRFSTTNAPNDLGVRISREELATIVGTATESLIRALTDLKETGAVEVHGREIRIAQPRELERIAGG
ncbi:MAG: response regulator [Flavobacteriales bacterium]|nr:response regulator [Flavobacteriales bacterium]